MYLNDFQKGIINKIIERKVFDINSFIEEYCGSFCKPRYNNHKGAYLIDKTGEGQLVSSIEDYIILWDKLQKNNLIKSVDRAVNHNYDTVYFSYDGESFPQHHINYLLEPYNDFRFYAFLDLEAFVKNDYKTYEELKTEEESKDRKISQRWTRILALSSIIFSVIALFVNTYYNHKYTNERKVEIINPGFGSDTTKVLLLNQIKDTVFVKDSIIPKSRP